jgi:AbrB family looped-hinge helix DNA binding protein
MTYTATITSKRQITLPVAIFEDFGLAVGQKLVIEKVNNQILINPVIQSIYKLMGSVKRPKKYRGMDIDTMIEKAKGDYFVGKYKYLNE